MMRRVMQMFSRDDHASNSLPLEGEGWGGGRAIFDVFTAHTIQDIKKPRQSGAFLICLQKTYAETRSSISLGSRST